MPRRTKPRNRRATAPSWHVRTHGHHPETIAKVIRLIQLNWKPKAIQNATNVAPRTIYRWESNILAYGSAVNPFGVPMGRPQSLTIADEDALLQTLLHDGWMQQDEMIHWLREERGVSIDQSTVSRLLKRND